MWYPAVANEAPTAEPVSLPDAKKHVRAEYHTDDDAYIGGLIAAARDHVERYTGTFVAQREVVAKCDCFADFAHVPVSPANSVVVTYLDTVGVEQTLADTVYELRNDDLRTEIVLKYGQNWPATQPGSRITATMGAGYEQVPPALKHALLLWIGDAYEVREPEPSGGRTAFDDLLTNFRR